MTTAREIAFIDPAVTDVLTFLAGLRPGVEPIMLDTSAPPSMQMVRALRGREGIDAIHIVAHGSPGAVSFGAGSLSLETVHEHANDLESIGDTLAGDGDILLWACASGRGERGIAFVEALARTTGAHVAAASDLVGSPALGGCWDLDAGSTAHAVRAPLTAGGMAAYAGVMAVINGTAGPDTLNDTSGNDEINGLGGDDTIRVSGGFDNVSAGSGTDRLIVSYASATGNITGNAGVDGAGGFSGHFGNSNDTQVNFGGVEHFTVITGGGDDNFNTGDGDDIVNTRAGDDRINTGNGNNVVNSGLGDDIVNVGTGTDDLDGSSGVDGLSAGLSGATSDITINLGANIYVTPGNSTIANFEYLTNFNSGSGNDTFVTLAVNRNDSVDTGSGNDSITVNGGGFDNVSAGLGTDRLIVNYASAPGNITGAVGADGAGGFSGHFGNSNDTQVNFGGVEHFTVTTGGGDDNFNTGAGDDIVNTGSGVDIVDARSGDNVVNSGSGDDIVNVGTGTEQLDGGTEVDGLTASLQGVASNITINLGAGIYVTPGNSTIANFEYLTNFNSGSGNDTLVTLAVNRNDSVDTGSGNDSITVMGGGFDNVSAGSDTDRLIVNYAGVLGNITGGVGVDSAGGFSGHFGNGNDTQVNFGSVERFTVNTGSGDDNFNTGAGDDIVITRAGNDIIDAGSGNNVVNSGEGDDIVNVGPGNDTLNGGSGVDGLSASLSGATSDMTIDVSTNTYVTPGNSTILNFEYLTNFNSGSGNDTLVTLAVNRNDSVDTGSGNDSITVNGGGFDNVSAGLGTDRLIVNYASAPGNITGGVGADGAGGFAGHFGNSNDTQVNFGGVEHFTVTTGGGDDHFNTGAGDDIVNTGSGNDIVDAGNGDNVVNSGSGDDIVDVGPGDDTLDGGSGMDGLSASLSGATSDMIVDVSTNTYLTPGNSTILNFEYLTSFNSGSGNDTFVTRAVNRNDSVDTGSGNDTVTVKGGGFDNVGAGLGTDRLIVNYASAPGNITGAVGADGAGGFAGHFGNSNDTQVNFGSVEHFTVTTGGGDDNFNTGAGDDIVDTRAGNDIVDAGSGNNVVNSGGGDDVVHVGPGDDTLEGGSGSDGLSASLSGATSDMTIDVSTNTYVTPGGSTILNFEYLTSFNSGSGNDTFVTNAVNRNDSFDTGRGNDTITVFGGGFDNVSAGRGTDHLIIDYTGVSGHITGSAGVDSAGGFSGHVGNSNNTQVNFSNVERFSFVMSGGRDSITTGSGADFVDGGAGNDTINGGGGNDTLLGGSGDDSLIGGSGIDRFEGGVGDDTYVVDATTEVVIESDDPGEDLVRSTSSFLLGANLENLELLGTEDNNGIGNTLANALTGNSGNNRLTGSDGDDTLIGGAGVDTLLGGAGNDILDGGSGVDSFSGGLGDDVYDVTASFEVVTEGASPDAGVDLVRATSGFNLGANVENLTLLGTNDTNGRGNELANVLTGNAGDNLLDGKDGDDILAGGAGVDELLGGAGNDSLDGGSGVDNLSGGLGDDVYDVDATTEAVVEGVGQGVDLVRSTSSFALGANVENLTLLSTGNTNGIGNTLANALTGNTGNNRLTGDDGNDVLDGGTGVDTLSGGVGHDILLWDTADASIHGGADGDILRFEGSGAALALGATIGNIENVDISGSGGNELTLSVADVLATSSTNTLQVDGNSDDELTVTGGGWTQGADAGNYRVYTQGSATLLVDMEIGTVSI